MRSVKTRGMDELASLRNRVRRAHAARRISKVDAAYIDKRLDEVEARIVRMRETNEWGEEER